METKFIDWRTVDLTKWLEASLFGPSSDPKMFRGSVAYNAPDMVKLTDDGFCRITIDHNDPLCHFRREFTEGTWPIRLADGTEDIYLWMYRFPLDLYKKPLNQVSIFQMYCRSEKVSDVMCQLEISKKDQIVGAKQGQLQMIHQSKDGKYRKLTPIMIEPGTVLPVEVRVRHGLQGSIRVRLGGTTVYDKPNDQMVFPADPVATAQIKFCVYHHTMNPEKPLVNGLNEGQEARKASLAAGIDKFVMDISPVLIIRRQATEPAFPASFDTLTTAPAIMAALIGALGSSAPQLQAALDAANTTIAGKDTLLTALNSKVTGLQADIDVARSTIAAKDVDLQSANGLIDSLQVERNNLLVTVTEKNGEIRNATARAIGLQDDIQSAEVVIEGKDTEIAELKGKLADVTVNYDTLQSANTDLFKQIDTAREELATETKAKNALAGKLNNIRVALSDLLS